MVYAILSPKTPPTPSPPLRRAGLERRGFEERVSFILSPPLCLPAIVLTKVGGGVGVVFLFSAFSIFFTDKFSSSNTVASRPKLGKEWASELETKLMLSSCDKRQFIGGSEESPVSMA